MTDAPFARKQLIFLLLLLTGIFFVNFLSRVVLSPLLPVIEKDLGLGHAAAGGFFMVIAVGYSVGLFGSGFITSRLTHRKTIALAALVGGLAFLLIAASQAIWLIRIGLFFLGISTGLYLPSGMTMITSSIPSNHWGKALAVHELAPSLAYLSAPLIVEALLVVSPWPTIIGLIGGAALILGLAFFRFAPGGNFTGEAPTLGNIRLLAGTPSFWIMVVLFCLALAASIGIYSMMPLYLVAERGFDRGTANTLIGLSRLPVIAMALVSGWISDRFGPKPTITMVLLFNGLTAILLGVLPGRWVILVVLIQPMLQVCFFPAGFTILSRIVPARARSLSIAMTMFIAYLGGAGAIPIILGAFGDAGAFGLAFILIGCITLLSAILLPRLELRKPGVE